MPSQRILNCSSSLPILLTCFNHLKLASITCSKPTLVTWLHLLDIPELRTIPRHKFPKLLHLALNKIAGSSISAAFSDRPLEFIPWILQRFVFPSLSLEPRRSQRPRLCLNVQRVCVSPVGIIQRTSWSNLDLLQQSSRTF